MSITVATIQTVILSSKVLNSLFALPQFLLMGKEMSYSITGNRMQGAQRSTALNEVKTKPRNFTWEFPAIMRSFLTCNSAMEDYGCMDFLFLQSGEIILQIPGV